MTYYPPTILGNIEPIRRKVFVSYSHLDQLVVDNFINSATQQGIFISKSLHVNEDEDFIDSDNPAYVMQQIRARHLEDSSVTIVLIGNCTHSRRYVDWEIKASLQQGQSSIPNGLIGILTPGLSEAYFPPRFAENWSSGHQNCYARCYQYPTTGEQLRQWIEDAHSARTSRAHLITNTQDMMKYNARCKQCGIAH